MKKQVLHLILSAAIFGGCGYYNENKAGSNGGGGRKTQSPTPGAEGLDFKEVKAKIFTPHCVKCHKGFNDYVKVANNLSDIQLAVDTDEMPKNGPPLSPELKRLLDQWINAGAPE